MSDMEYRGDNPSGNEEFSQAYEDGQVTSSWEASGEYGELEQRIQGFDKNRHELYDLLSNVMSGASEIVEEEVATLLVMSAKSYSAIAGQLLTEGVSQDACADMIFALYSSDESERVNLFSQLAPNLEFRLTSKQVIDELREGFTELEDHDDYVSAAEACYGESLQKDIMLLATACPVPTENPKERYKKMARSAATDVAKMAGAAIIAVALSRRFPRS